MQYIKSIQLFLIFMIVVALPSCGGDEPEVIDCIPTSSDSILVGDEVQRIHSAGMLSPVYMTGNAPNYILINRVRSKSDGSNVSIQFMLHPSVGPEKAILVLILGGQLNSFITSDGVGGVSFAGNDFLVRSAHLFAAQGYKVVTLDRPSDYVDDIPDGETAGYLYDQYRISPRHAVDISMIINRVNSSNLPVVFIGISRGANSSVAQSPLAAAIALASPVTVPNIMGGTYIGDAEESIMAPGGILNPTQVLWHQNDLCNKSPPDLSLSIVDDFSIGVGSVVSGGFIDPDFSNPCGAHSYHGFMGIESCAVSQVTSKLDDLFILIPGTRPQARSIRRATSVDNSITVNLNDYVSGVGPFTFGLHHSQSSLGGNMLLSGTEVTYTPPAGLSNTMDTFVYIVTDNNGGTSNNVISVYISP